MCLAGPKAEAASYVGMKNNKDTDKHVLHMSWEVVCLAEPPTNNFYSWPVVDRSLCLLLPSVPIPLPSPFGSHLLGRETSNGEEGAAAGTTTAEEEKS